MTHESENILLQHLPPVPNDKEIASYLLSSPIDPVKVLDLPFAERLQIIQDLRRHFWVPTPESIKIAKTIDSMIRYRYRHFNPTDSKTWSVIYGTSSTHVLEIEDHIGASVVGPPGSGKSTTIFKALSKLPQIILHEKFPNIQNEHYQMVWLSLRAPATGRVADFALKLMRQWDSNIERAGKLSPKFSDYTSKPKNDASYLFDKFEQATKTHMLGLLHLDEVQNFFKINTKQERLRGIYSTIKIKEDALILRILDLLNSGIAILISGTIDGVSALQNRLSTSQRLSSFGYFNLKNFDSLDDPNYKNFFNHLFKYQYVKNPCTNPSQLAKVILDLTGGLQRLIIILWIQAHEMAYSRAKDDLIIEDFLEAANCNFGMIKPAIEALKSKDPKLIAKYLDLLKSM